jgi:ribosomal-protein-alanine N-acetyltransferase
MVEIRHTTLADIPQIQALEIRSATAAHWNAGQYKALFADDAPERIVLVAQNDHGDQEVVGFLIARCLAGDWEIENIVVEDRHKKQGIGMRLMRQLLSEARVAGAISIILEVRDSNTPARRLYESIGFKSDGRRKSYYKHPNEDAILYRRSLQFCDKIP